MAVSTAQKKKGKGEEEEFDSEFWMVTFGDLLSLMLTFFVLLFSMASLDKQTLDDMLEEFKGGAGLLSSGNPFPLEPSIQTGLMKVRPGEAKALLNLVKNQTKKSGKEFDAWQAKGAIDTIFMSGATVRTRGSSFVISFPVENLFDQGSAEVKPNMEPALKRLGQVFRFSTTDLLIEGHTDDIPVSSLKFASNWELSATRAANVMRFLAENTPIKRDRLLAFGYADTKPLVRNLSDIYRARNRRVDIVIRQSPEV